MANTDTFYANENLQTNNVLVAPQNGVAAAGTTQATATQLGDVGMAQVTTAAAGSGVILSASASGKDVVVVNNGANAVLVYCAVGETMNGTSNGSSSVAVGAVTIFYCFVKGAWVTK